jgi:hypothetical protein
MQRTDLTTSSDPSRWSNALRVQDWESPASLCYCRKVAQTENTNCTSPGPSINRMLYILLAKSAQSRSASNRAGSNRRTSPCPKARKKKMTLVRGVHLSVPLHVVPVYGNDARDCSSSQCEAMSFSFDYCSCQCNARNLSQNSRPRWRLTIYT